MIHARPVSGRYRRLRLGANAILIGILLGIPWVRIGGEPLVLLDIPARQFHIAGLVIFPQELIYLWMILALLALSLFFFTALAGRLWCGWACPQTVFTDVFAIIGRFVQGWKGHRAPRKIAAWRVALTHVLWIAVSVVVGFHLVGYFVSPYELLPQLLAGETPPTRLGFLTVMATLSYLDFGFVKQTFCRTLCPYARFQGVLMDADSLVIGYDTKRGEPRGKKGRAEGDCVDCGLCVQVCPTGIDIRDGLQLECIACTQCVDACDGVMERLGRKRGLVDYRSLVSLEGRRPVEYLRPRVLAYGVLLLLTAGAFVVTLSQREPMGLHVAHNRDALSTRAADGRLGNAFTLRIENRARSERRFSIALEAEGPPFELVAGVNPVTIDATSAVESRVFVLAPPDTAPAEALREIAFVLSPVDAPDHRVVRRMRFLPGGASIVP
ncbi:MAG: cytochrome c oxidase accessory protein CcoG [Myxococcota bacterium]|nr:cytochrome c oxidase accessory protein CcoG [Myxococcota bacterium]